MDPVLTALIIIILLFSVVVHEVMHGLVALLFGDTTAERAGRLTLNPIPHIDPIGTILLPLMLFLSGSPFMFAWAKPVPVNPLNFKDLRKGELWVSAAGILANFSLAIVAAVFYHLLNAFSATSEIPLQAVRYMVYINLLLGVFNLFPIPPLDGSKVLLSQLPYNLAREYQKIERYGFIILLLLLLIPLGQGSLLNFVLSFFVSIFGKILGF